MNTYALLSGESIEYPDQPAAVSAFLWRVQAAVNDPNTTPADVLALAYGTENPILDTTSQPGRAVVTKAVFENPVYRIFADLVGRKQMIADGQTRDDVAAAYTVSVKEAARRLDLTESSVRTAITNRKLSAMKVNGDWYIHPNSVASYKVSNRGRKKPPQTAEQPASAIVRVICGSAKGASLSVRIAGEELVTEAKLGNVTRAHFPDRWARAAIRTTSGAGTRVFEVEPAPADAAGEVVQLGGFSVSGPFKIVKKHNATAAAGAAWKRYAREKATA